MLVIESQPNPLKPHELGKPTEWIVAKTDFVQDTGAVPFANFSFQPGAIGDGLRFTMLGDSNFSTDSSRAFSSSTFDGSAGGLTAANNFASMLRTNPLFNDWSISVEIDGLPVVRARFGESATADNFVFDLSSLSGSVGSTVGNGRPEDLAKDNFWYQFWTTETPASEKKTGSFDPSGRSRIDGQATAGRLVDASAPSLAWTGPFLDKRMTACMYVRFGTFTTGEDGSQVFGDSAETAKVTVINAVTQPEQYRQFRPYVPEYQLPVRWLSNRPTTYSLPRDAYDWIAVYIAESSIVGPPITFSIQYFDAAGSAIGSAITTNTGTEPGVYRFPIGPANAIHDSRVLTADHFTLTANLGVPVNYANTIRVNLCDGGCPGPTLVYLEDAGSWRALRFEALEGLNVDTEGSPIVSPINYQRPGANNPTNLIYPTGGRQILPTRSDDVWTARSERITRNNYGTYSEFLRSKKHFVLWRRPDIGVDALWPIQIDRSSYPLLSRGRVERLLVPFRFNISKTLRP